MEGKKLSFQLNCDLENKVKVNVQGPVHHLGAKAKIKEYEDAESELKLWQVWCRWKVSFEHRYHNMPHSTKFSQLCFSTAARDEEKKKEIVLLSRSANIISKYTAFIGVDKGRVEKVKGQMERREVPLAEREAVRVSQSSWWWWVMTISCQAPDLKVRGSGQVRQQG